MPTSMTVAPGLIQSPRIYSARPMATNSRFGAAAQIRQIAGMRMRDGHRCVRGEQQLPERIADDVGAADHQRIEPVSDGRTELGELDAGDRRARHKRR